jgi:DNA polymerase III epsilon subunit-like protein
MTLIANITRIPAALLHNDSGIRKALKKTDAKIAFLDIETAPSVGWIWGKWEQNVLDFIKNGYVLSYAFKTAYDKNVKIRALPDYTETWAKDKEDDSTLLRELWNDMNSVDIIVAHNGDKFDIPQIHTRFATLGWAPTRPFQTIDTLKIARQKFKFKSNKLDDLGRDLGIGRKTPHTGFKLWIDCMAGDTRAWKTMKKYNAQDVLLLEELYHRFLPWAGNLPNANRSAEERCIRCGSSNIKKEGERFTTLRKKAQIRCSNCGGWFEGSAKKQ